MQALEPVSSFDYRGEMTRAMELLAEDPRVVFIGQAVGYPGTYMSSTLSGPESRIELPVAEEMQMGMSIGFALSGHVPVSIYPRWNFLILAANQLVNHLDKMKAHVIVRVGVGSCHPMHPGVQHIGDFTEPFRAMCQNTHFKRLHRAKQIVPAYSEALERAGPTVLVEYAEKYQ